MPLRDREEVKCEKLEQILQQDNVKDVWSDMRSIPGYKQTGNQVRGLFLNRVDSSAPLNNPLLLPPFPHLFSPATPYLFPPQQHYRAHHTLDTSRHNGAGREPGKAAGPDGVSPKCVLSCCMEYSSTSLT